jgi:hypothetical protein
VYLLKIGELLYVNKFFILSVGFEVLTAVVYPQEEHAYFSTLKRQLAFNGKHGVISQKTFHFQSRDAISKS